MGQRIQVDETTVIGDSAILSTDRVLTGMAGVGFDSVEEARGSDRFPAILAARIFEMDGAVRRVYVYSNEAVITRSGGWSDSDLAASGEVVETFLLHYGA